MRRRILPVLLVLATTACTPPAAVPATTTRSLHSTTAAVHSAAPTGSPTLSAYILDVAQGDSTVVLGPTVNGERKVLVMDAGHYNGNNGKRVEELLISLRVDHIDHVVLSHYDADHMGGFLDRSPNDGLLWTSQGPFDAPTSCTARSWFPRATIADTGAGRTNLGIKHWLKCVGDLTSSGSPSYWRVENGDHVGDVLDLGGGASARIVAGRGHVWGKATAVRYVNTSNERSIALLVSDGHGFDFLVTGDLIGQKAGDENAKVEIALGEQLAAQNIDVEVLRTGHHGAANATEASFVENVSPEVAVISCGDNQPSNFQHPRCRTYQTLSAAHVPVILQTETGATDCPDDVPASVRVVDGTIHIEVDTAGYSLSSHGTTGANGQPTQAIDYRCTATGCTMAGAATCCRMCRTSKPCGNSCIPRSRNCTKPPGCACAQ